MTFEEAMSEAVLGARVRHAGMQEGAYIYYQFAGWRIQFGNGEGSNSGWSSSDADKAADWFEYEPVAPRSVKTAYGAKFANGGFVDIDEPYTVGSRVRPDCYPLWAPKSKVVETASGGKIIATEVDKIETKPKIKLDPNKGGW